MMSDNQFFDIAQPSSSFLSKELNIFIDSLKDEVFQTLLLDKTICINASDIALRIKSSETKSAVDFLHEQGKQYFKDFNQPPAFYLAGSIFKPVFDFVSEQLAHSGKTVSFSPVNRLDDIFIYIRTSNFKDSDKETEEIVFLSIVPFEGELLDSEDEVSYLNHLDIKSLKSFIKEENFLILKTALKEISRSLSSKKILKISLNEFEKRLQKEENLKLFNLCERFEIPSEFESSKSFKLAYFLTMLIAYNVKEGCSFNGLVFLFDESNGSCDACFLPESLGDYSVEKLENADYNRFSFDGCENS